MTGQGRDMTFQWTGKAARVRLMTASGVIALMLSGCTEGGEFALFKSQAAGQLAESDLHAAFVALDADRNGRISKSEFFQGAADVLFHAQMGRLKVWQRMEESSEEAR